MILSFFFLVLASLSWSKTTTLEVDLMSFCQDPLHQTKEAQKVCSTLYELQKHEARPIQIIKADSKGNELRFRFSFGFSRTDYAQTDLHLQSPRLNVVIKDYDFHERTSAENYEPKHWNQGGPTDFLKWVDEPTNTFTFTIERKKDVFTITVFHPKFLQEGYMANKQVTGTVDGVKVDKEMSMQELGLSQFKNTHREMSWQIGYGRSFVLYKGKRGRAELIYTPQLLGGFMTGKNVSGFEKEEFEDRSRIQGSIFSAGHSLEYRYGIASLFVNQTFHWAHLNHGFLEGKAKYNLDYSTITFGLGINLYDPARHKKRPKVQEQ